MESKKIPLKEPSTSKPAPDQRSEEHTSELQSQSNLVCRLLLEKKKKKRQRMTRTPRCGARPLRPVSASQTPYPGSLRPPLVLPLLHYPCSMLLDDGRLVSPLST